MAISKVVYGNQTLIDLTHDTITPDKLAEGVTAHAKDGSPITGTNTFDADTSDADASASELLVGKTMYVNGVKITGTMPDRNGQGGFIGDVNQEVSIQQGHHDGSGKVGIDATEKAKIIAENIKEGVTILGVTGNVSPASGVKAQAKTTTPYTTAQTLLPDTGFDYLSQVTVEAISYVETENAAGGTTVTIGTVAPTP